MKTSENMRYVKSFMTVSTPQNRSCLAHSISHTFSHSIPEETRREQEQSEHRWLDHLRDNQEYVIRYQRIDRGIRLEIWH